MPFSKVKSRTFANAYKNRGISFMARANGRNIVGCYTLRPFAHPVACCCVLLHKSFKSVKLLSKCKRTQQLLKLLAQKCWELLRPFVRSLKYLGSSKYVHRGVARFWKEGGGGGRGSYPGYLPDCWHVDIQAICY